jgi:hypothetical protein
MYLHIEHLDCFLYNLGGIKGKEFCFSPVLLFFGRVLLSGLMSYALSIFTSGFRKLTVSDVRPALMQGKKRWNHKIDSSLDTKFKI